MIIGKNISHQLWSRNKVSAGYLLFMIVSAAIAVRITYRIHLGSSDFWQNGYQFYYIMARNIMEGNGLSIDGVYAMRPPVYPYFLAVTRLAGENYLLIIIPQALFGGVTVVSVYLIAGELFEQKTALIAAVMTAFYPYYVVHDTAMQETGLFTATSALAVYMMLRARHSHFLIIWLIAGFLLGAAVLVRSTALPFALGALIWIALLGDGPGIKKVFRGSAVFFVFAILVGAWLGRNYVVIGRPVLTSEVGALFWVAHNAQTFSHYPIESIDRSSDAAMAALSPAENLEIERLGADELGLSDWFLNKGLVYIQNHPLETAYGALRKVGAGFSWTFNPVRESVVQAVYLVSYGPISILGPLGMVLARRRWKEHGLIYLQFFAFIIVSMLYWAHTSHRSYLDIYLIIYAAYMLTLIVETIGRWLSTLEKQA